MSESTAPRTTRSLPEENVREKIETTKLNENDRALIAVGVTGVGKSTFLNFLLDSSRFKSASGLKSVTQASEAGTLQFGERNYVVVDTPGVLDSGTVDLASGSAYAQAMDQCDIFMKHLEKALHEAGQVAHAIVLLFNIQRRFSIESSWMIDALERLRIGFDHVVVVFTHGGHLGSTDDERYERFGRELQNPRSVHCGLKDVLDKVDNRYLIVESVNIDEDVKAEYHERVVEHLATEVDKIADKPILNERWALIQEQWEEKKKFEREIRKTKLEIEDELREVQRLQELQGEIDKLEKDCQGLVQDIESKRKDIHSIHDDLPHFEVDFSDITGSCERIEASNEEMRERCETLRELISTQSSDIRQFEVDLEEVRSEEARLSALGIEENRHKELERLNSILTAGRRAWPELNV